MGLLDSYQDSTDTALTVMASRPIEPEAPKAKHSAWSTPFRAVAASAAEVAGNVMDTAGAFGQVVAATGGIGPGIDPDARKNRQASIEAMDTLKRDGINWRTDEAKQAYQFGADLRPDPLTAGTAENLVFSLIKGLTKAIGAAATLGPVGGAAAFGTSEGMTTAEDLANQGVDKTTRAKVGIVSAGVNALGLALPVAGKTLTQTTGLVVAGGPGSFITQQLATREILRNANYKELADQYDPLDPVGLAVSTLLPAGFAAYAKRGGFRQTTAVDGQNAPKSQAPQETGVSATPEAVDAAMVQNLTIARDVHQDTTVEKFAAELWRAPVTDNPNFKAWFDGSKVSDENGNPLVVYHGTRADFDAFDLSRQGQANGLMFSRGIYLTSNPEYAEMMTRGEPGGNIIPAYVSLKNPLIFDSYKAAHDVPIAEWSRIERGGIHDGIIVKDNGELSEIVVFRPEQIKSAIGNSGLFDPYSQSLTDPAPAARVADEAPTATVKESLSVQPEPAVVKDSFTTETTNAYAARVEALTKEQPDLIVRMDDAGQPLSLTEELAAIKKQAQEGTDTEFGALDAPLLKIAAECALSIGTAGI